jgi:hypothetical protein
VKEYVAYQPDWVTPVSLNQINNGKNAQYYYDNDLSPRPTTVPPPSPFSVTYDGFTAMMRTKPYVVKAGLRYSVKMAIADVGDYFSDSVVWIKGEGKQGIMFGRLISAALSAVAPFNFEFSCYRYFHKILLSA